MPEWFYKRNDQGQNKHSTDSSVDFEKERQKILQKLGQQDGQVK